MKKLSIAAATCSIFLMASGALASSDIEDNIRALDGEARQHFRNGQSYQESGDFSSACSSYRSANAAWNKAMWQVPGLARDPHYNNDNADAALKVMQAGMNEAKANAAAVCGKTSESVSRSSGSSQSGSEQDYDPDHDAKRAVQATVTLGASYAKAAFDKYEAEDFAGACASSRQAAEAFASASRALKGNDNLASAFGNVSQVYENAKQSVLDRDEFYCAG